MMFGAVALFVTGCSAATSATQASAQNSTGNQASAGNTANAGTTNNSSGQTTSIVIGNATNAVGVGNTTGQGSGMFGGGAGSNADVQSVIAGIQASPAQMTSAVGATTSGQPYGAGLQIVQFTSENVGFLAGRGIILKTTNGGQYFQTAYRANIDFTGLAASPASKQTIVAWADRAIVRSTDGGAKWTRESLPPTGADIQQVDFPTSSEGFAITGNVDGGTLWRTSDGGAHWNKVPTPAGGVQSASFGSASTGWIGLANGDIDRSGDGGAHWSTVFHPGGPYPGRPLVQAVSNQAAWALMIGGSGMSQTSYSVFRTTDGVTWKPVQGVSTAGAGPAPDGATKAPKGPGSSAGPMVALNANQAVVTGVCEACGMGSGQVSSTDNGGSSWNTYPTVQNGMSMPTSVSFVSLSNGWMLDNTVGGGAFLLRTTDGGQTWREVYPMVHPHPIEGVSFLNANVGYGLGVPGNASAVLKSTNGGQTWWQVGSLPANSSSTPVTLGNSPISFISETRGYAIGADGTVYQTANGGQSWTVLLPAKQQNPYDSIVFLPGGQYGVVNSYGQNTEVTVDGGRTWHAVNVPSNSNNPAQTQLYLTALARLPIAPTIKTLIQAESAGWFDVANAQVAVVPGQNERSIFITTNGGIRWHIIDFGHYLNASTIDFVNSQDGWMITVFGSLLRTTNGGQTWTYAVH